MAGLGIKTERLRLREWCEADIGPILEMRADPRVMATLGPLQSRGDVEASFARQTTYQRNLGFCSWIVERSVTGEVIGTCGFQPIVPGTPIGDTVEIGWKLKFAAWGQGFATEAARACLNWYFANRIEETAWAITSVGNARSRAVMERLGMLHRTDLDFDHPKLAEDDPLICHVTYSIGREAWEKN